MTKLEMNADSAFPRDPSLPAAMGAVRLGGDVRSNRLVVSRGPCQKKSREVKRRLKRCQELGWQARVRLQLAIPICKRKRSIMDWMRSLSFALGLRRR